MRGTSPPPPEVALYHREKIRPQLEKQVAEYAIHPSAPRVFLSWKFGEDSKRLLLINTIKQAINESGCFWLEAEVDSRDENSKSAIYSRLWKADCCIALAFDAESQGILSPNQAHELGFIQGQDKPWRIVVKEGDRGILQRNFSNLPDSIYIHYNSVTDEIVPNKEDGMAKQIRNWLVGNFRIQELTSMPN